MTKIGRNEPCPCGSDRKYKLCCLSRHEADRAAAQANDHALKAAATAIDRLIFAGRIDDAESSARDLIQRYPDRHQGHFGLGLVHQMRGNHQAAADCYRDVLEILYAHPERYTPEFIAEHRSLAFRVQEDADFVKSTTPVNP
jgi:tetratricopeptide (TPR) repeat protein